ncbi:hypothetical protein J7T55_015416 [Diaporthe amygdali]|uniref:uncharacterized protein n=1 Tax=Phomopsis amygdali TaxID=1214568 RepID=UPI0022FF0076|nr:uncharacterized protein J7T55_015416 [Diaporthe amygdali]KAJ0120684.1 hypothetical protein J7T55_015416 [Diaporthe amygdali]
MSDAQIMTALTGALAGSAVLRPGSSEFEKDNGSYFSAFENEIKPSFIAKPATVKQVQDLIRALRPYLLDGSCQVAVRGTGHTPFAGSANIQNGVTIDTRGLKGINLGDDTVEVGSGETWETVYKELENHGLTTAGGRVGRVGVAGLVLGGGLSMFSGKTGFACDSVLEFEIVLASGEVVRANAEANSDLWIALRGGLNNFGIVTSLKLRTFKSESIWGGVTYYMPETFSQLVRGACDFALNEKDQDAHVMASAGYGFGHQVVTCVMYHVQGKENPPSLERFTTMEPQIKQMSTMRTSTHLGFCDELSKFSSDGLRQYWASITIKPDIPLMEAFYQRWQETLSRVKDSEGFIFSFGFHPITKALLEESQKAGGNAMDIPPSDGPLFVVLINPAWKLADDDTRIFAEVESLVKELRRLARDKGLLHRYIFTNYGYSKDDVIAGYGDESVSKLKATSEKYDPEGLFQKGVPGGFKLTA